MSCRTVADDQIKIKSKMKQTNHRTRVAAERRERTRTRLLESALAVFAEKGPEVPIIDDVITHAGVSRGSFYNYFKTNEELLEAVAIQVGNDLIRIVDPAVCAHTDPVLRMATALRLLLHSMRRAPVLAAFIARLRWPKEGALLEGTQSVSRDILEGMRTGVLTVNSSRAALDLFVGTFFCAANTIVHENVPDSYPDEISECILHGLSVQAAKAMQAMALPLPTLSFDGTSILSKLGTPA
jgi:AcrR family transcriptional regulator